MGRLCNQQSLDPLRPIFRRRISYTDRHAGIAGREHQLLE